jgi:hypothetical protein
MKNIKLKESNKMNKFTRILFVMACLAAMIALGLQGTAWASKLSTGNPAPIAKGLKQEVLIPYRPDGTVVTPGTPVTVPGTYTAGVYPTVVLPPGVTLQLLTTLPPGISAPAGKTIVPGSLLEFGTASGTGNIPVAISVTLPTLATGQTVAFWNGSAWVNLTPVNGIVTIPAGTPAPVVLAIFAG